MVKDLWEGVEPGTDSKKSAPAKSLIGLNVSPEYALTVEDQPDAKTAYTTVVYQAPRVVGVNKPLHLEAPVSEP